MTDDERRFTITMEIDGEEVEYQNCRVQSMDEAKQTAEEIRENAPESVALTDGKVCDIDDVIDALQAAKERGVDTVYVNDDGRTRQFQPRITNNHRQHHALQPEPGELFEWVEL
jgi:uncharacterized radical SAM superfamily Fe-S cluster-containing enzyme